jgi:hypothetical protein
MATDREEIEANAFMKSSSCTGSTGAWADRSSGVVHQQASGASAERTDSGQLPDAGRTTTGY